MIDFFLEDFIKTLRSTYGRQEIHKWEIDPDNPNNHQNSAIAQGFCPFPFSKTPKPLQLTENSNRLADPRPKK